MASVGTPVIRRIVQVSRGPEPPERLLAQMGLPADVDPGSWTTEAVDVEVYYELLERVAGYHDPGLPFRYGRSIQVDDFGALGLAMKTAPRVRDALLRLVRYVLVLSDTLSYELEEGPGGPRFLLRGRSHHRRGAQLANECALAAVTSVLRQLVTGPIGLRGVSFCHAAPESDEPHREYYRVPVRWSSEVDGLLLVPALLERRTRLGDHGLSAYLLDRLEDLYSQTVDRSLAHRVSVAVASSLPDGQPSKSQVARQLGYSERTLHRRLADEGHSFQELATQVRREAAESLLQRGTHSLTDVAFLTGFSDQAAFTRAFKRWTGRTPGQWRVSVG